MYKNLLFIFITFVYSCKTYSQANDVEAALYNISFGALTSAAGALFNKKPNEKAGKVIFKGLYQGALGGYVTFESKRVLREASKEGDWKLFWSSKLINAAGNSIKENASNNIDFWERWYLPIGFNRIELETKDKFSIKYKIMPVSAVYTIDAFFLYKFDLESSLKIGQFFFNENNPYGDQNASASAGYIVFNKGKNSSKSYTEIMAHEIIHIYQAEDFLFVNSFYHKKVDELLNKNSTLQKINENLYFDFHLLPLRGLYIFEKNNAKNYYDNFFEHEAGYYSYTLY